MTKSIQEILENKENPAKSKGAEASGKMEVKFPIYDDKNMLSALKDVFDAIKKLPTEYPQNDDIVKAIETLRSSISAIEIPEMKDYPKNISINEGKAILSALAGVKKAVEDIDVSVNIPDMSKALSALPKPEVKIPKILEVLLTEKQLKRIASKRVEAVVTNLAPIIAYIGGAFSQSNQAFKAVIVADQSKPVEGYQATDIEDGTTAYYGFIDKDGNWYIQKVTSTEVRYVKGSSDYTTNWTNRASLSYDYFNNVF